MVKLVVFALSASIVYVLLKKYAPEFSQLSQLFAAAAVLLFILPQALSLLNFVQNFFDQSGVDRSYFVVLLKITGIALLTQFAADTCRDSGETALASQTEFAGKILMLISSVPLMKALMQTAAQFFSPS